MNNNVNNYNNQGNNYNNMNMQNQNYYQQQNNMSYNQANISNQNNNKSNKTGIIVAAVVAVLIIIVLAIFFIPRIVKISKALDEDSNKTSNIVSNANDKVNNSNESVTKFEAHVYIFTKEEGGRHTPFFNSYKPQFNFANNDITGTIELLNGIEMVMPGDTVDINIELTTPIAMKVGTEFSISEAGRKLGTGTVTKIIK